MTEIADYKEQIYDLLQSLEVLDGLDKEGNEAASEALSVEREELD